MKIVVLEDNRDRREAMGRYLADRLSSFEAVFFEWPQPMVGYLREHLCDAVCISLDHDMELMTTAKGSCSTRARAARSRTSSRLKRRNAQ